MKKSLYPLIFLIMMLILSSCSATGGSASVPTSSDAVTSQSSSAQDDEDSLYAQLEEAQEDLKNKDARIDYLEDQVQRLIDKYGIREVVDGQFRAILSFEECGIKQGISSPDPNFPEESIMVYDIPSRLKGVGMAYASDIYLEILAQVSATSIEENYEQTVWYLVKGNSIEDCGNVFWIPAANVVEYTSENMYSIYGSVHVREGATFSRSKSMSNPNPYSLELHEYDLGIIEQYDTGVSMVAFRGGGVLYVYTKDLVYPEPLK